MIYYAFHGIPICPFINLLALEHSLFFSDINALLLNSNLHTSLSSKLTLCWRWMYICLQTRCIQAWTLLIKIDTVAYNRLLSYLEVTYSGVALPDQLRCIGSNGSADGEPGVRWMKILGHRYSEILTRAWRKLGRPGGDIIRQSG